MIRLLFPAEEFKIASLFSRQANIKGISCSRGDFQINELVKIIKAENIKLNHIGKFKHVSNINTLFVEIEMSADYLESNKQVPVVHIKGVFMLVYELTVNLPVEEEVRDLLFSSFTKICCLHHVWPYWREYCDSMARRMNLTGFVIAPLHIDAQKTQPEVAKEHRGISRKARKQNTIK